MQNNNEIIFATGSCRISSAKQQSGDSLEEQERQIKYFAKSNDWVVSHIFSRVFSGRAEERDDFEEILDYIKTQKKKGIQIHKHIIYNIDRLTRNGAIVFQQMKKALKELGTELVDVGGVIQPELNTLGNLGFEYKWSMVSPTASAQLAKAQEANEEVTKTLTRMVGAEIRLVQDGYKVRGANDGFINQKLVIDGKRKVVEIPDPERANFFRDMFELRVQNVDDKEIVNRINALGFKTKPRNVWDKARKTIIGRYNGKPLDVKQFQRYIQRPIYAGIKIEKWTHFQPIRAQYAGLVSIDKFNLANHGKVFIKENDDGSVQLLYNHSQFGLVKTRRLRNNPDYRYKFLPCDICSKPMLGSRSRGKSGAYFLAYHCGGAHSGVRSHKYIRVPKEKYESAISNYLKSLRFEQAYLDSFELVLNDVYRTREKEIISQSSSISLNVGNLKAQQASAIDALMVTKSPAAQKKLDEKIEELEKQIQGAETQRDEIEVTEKDIKTFVKNVKAIMEHPADFLMNIEDIRALRTIFGLVFEEFPTYTEILNGTPKLSLAFKLSEEYNNSKSQYVTSQRIEL
jgi:site-specific DNA recombinase